MKEEGEIVLCQPDELVKLEVRLEDENVWLTQAQIVELFQSSKANISEHITNIYEQEELDEASTVRDFRTVRLEGKRQVVRTLTSTGTMISIRLSTSASASTATTAFSSLTTAKSTTLVHR